MKEPTDEQLREFWEWCGLDIEECGSGEKLGELFGTDVIDSYIIVHYPDGGNGRYLPATDLNNLFRWAVPKVFERLSANAEKVAFINDAVCDSIANECTITLALFWAIWEVIQNERDTTNQS